MVLQSDEAVSHSHFPVDTPLVCNTGFHCKHFKLLQYVPHPSYLQELVRHFIKKKGGRGFLLKQGNNDKARDISDKKVQLAWQNSYPIISLTRHIQEKL